MPSGWNLPLDQQISILVRPSAVLLEPGQRRQAGKDGIDEGELAPVRIMIPAGPLSDDGADSIHYNGLAGSRFPRQSVESLVELNVRRFDNCDILNVQQ